MTHYWFISTKYRKRSKLALLTVTLAFIVIMFGAYTRLTDAGLSCPDWPNCFGYITAPYTPAQLQTAIERYPSVTVDVKKAWTEMTHRYLAGTEGVLIILLVSSIMLVRKKVGSKTSLICAALIAALGLQVVLGMLTVTAKLKPVIVLAHLLTGLFILGLLWWTYLDLHVHEGLFANKASAKVIPWFWLGLIILTVQITLGGWVSTHYAGLACIDFPYCNGEWLPTLHLNHFDQHLITIHMLHRIGALVTILYLGILSLRLLAFRTFRSFGVLILALLGLQGLLGVLNIVWLRPVWVALAHHGVAILLLLSIITALAKAYYESRYARYDSWLQ